MVLTAVCGIALAYAMVEPDIVYKKVGDVELKVDFYPPASVGSKPSPFVLVVHGGGWTSGDRLQLKALNEGLSKIGIASGAVQYRLAPKTKWPAMLDDVQACVRYFRANATKYSIDPNQFGAMGASAGGHLSLLLGSMDTREKDTKDFAEVSSRVKCVVNFFGPTDLSQDFDPTVASILCNAVLGKPYKSSDPDIVAFSPVSHIDKLTSPVFTIHGKADTLVPPKQTERLDEAMKKAGVKHEFRMIDGMVHTIDVNNEQCVKALQDAMNFLLDQFGMARIKIEKIPKDIG